MSLYNLLGFMIVTGNGSASNINVAHEFLHKDGFIDKIFATFTLTKNLYMHFTIEYRYGHHKNVATLADPATSRRG